MVDGAVGIPRTEKAKADTRTRIVTGKGVAAEIEAKEKETMIDVIEIEIETGDEPEVKAVTGNADMKGKGNEVKAGIRNEDPDPRKKWSSEEACQRAQSGCMTVK